MYEGRAATSFMFIVEVVASSSITDMSETYNGHHCKNAEKMLVSYFIIIQCLPMDTTFYRTTSGAQAWSFIYRVEYQEMNKLVTNCHEIDFPCAVCYVPTRAILYYTS